MDGIIFAALSLVPPHLRGRRIVTKTFDIVKKCILLSREERLLNPICLLLKNGIDCAGRTAVQFTFTAEPKSRGRVRLEKDGFIEVDPRYFESTQDLFDVIRGVQSIVERLNGDAFRGVLDRLGRSACPVFLMNAFLQLIALLLREQPFTPEMAEKLEEVKRHNEDLNSLYPRGSDSDNEEEEEEIEGTSSSSSPLPFIPPSVGEGRQESMLRLASMQRLLEDLINEDTADLPEDPEDEEDPEDGGESKLPPSLSPPFPPLSPPLPSLSPSPPESILFPFSSISSQLKKQRKSPQTSNSPLHDKEKKKKVSKKSAPLPQDYVYIPLDRLISPDSSSSAFSETECSRACKVLKEEDETHTQIKKALQTKKCPYRNDVFYQLYNFCQQKAPFSSSSSPKAEKVYFSKTGDRLEASEIGYSGSKKEKDEEENEDNDNVFYLRVKIRNRSYEDANIFSTSDQWVASYPPILPSPEDPVQLAEYVLTYMTSIWHHGGTAAMGTVVDDLFRVKGIDGLSIVDASILPQIPRMNPTATLIMMGRYAALKKLASQGAEQPQGGTSPSSLQG
ncbi:gmc oxidoreductase [Cystoisospora suis]|uniref:Gmc oxidoreductase n=1 Tax=Cystoisospora suis TaxID=483139 RepID=A0A2C6KX08_9APIC|nr:gmc oxidoreductase [Cystoisospora suis]